MKKLLLTLLLGMFMISLCSAVTSDFTFKAGDVIDLKIPCYNNGTYCSTIAKCNVTINYPNGTNLIKQAGMTNQYSYHNYTWSNSYTWVSGIYFYSVLCNDNNLFGVYDGYVQITPTGSSDILGYFILIILIPYLLIIFGTWKEDITITTLGSLAAIILGLYVLFYGIDIYKNYLTNAFALINIFIGGYISIVMGLELFKE